MEITIEGKKYRVEDIPELQEMLNQARKEQKDKLQQTIDALKQRINTLEIGAKNDGGNKDEINALKQELEKIKQEKSELQKLMAEEKKNQKKQEEEITALQEIKKLLAEQKQETEKTIQKYESELTELKKSLQQTTLQQRKNEILSVYGDRLIPEFLDNATTVEELEKLLPTALEKSKKYIHIQKDGKTITLEEAEKIEQEQKKKQEQQAPQYIVVNPENAPKPPETPNEAKLDISKMTPEEFKKHEALLKQQMIAEWEGKKKK